MFVKLGEICNIKSGKRLPLGKNLIITNTGYPYLRLTDCGEKYPIPDNIQFLEKDVYEKIKSYKIYTNEVYLSVVGTIGIVGIISEQFDGINLTENANKLVIKDRNKVNPEYLYYWLKSDIGQKAIQKGVVGSIQPKLPMYNIENFEIDLPSKGIQDKIANILSSIDNQIERNNAMTKRLQDMILTRYSVMFQNKTNKNGLLKDICLLPSGHNFKPEIYNNYGEYKLITIKNVYNTFIDDINTDKISEVPNIKDYCYLSIGDILLSLTGNVGRISIVHSKNNLLNQRVSLLQAKENYKIYSYCLLKSQEYQFIMTNIARGTSQKNLSPIDVENLQIYIPAFEEIKTFNESTEKYFNEMLIIKQSTETLIKLKNKLLPLLINGQLEV